jgi:hypothetical protein
MGVDHGISATGQTGVNSENPMDRILGRRGVARYEHAYDHN